MWQIIQNEWQFLRRTKLMVGLSLGFAVVLLVAIILANFQTQKQAKAYHEAKDHLRSQWESIDAMNPHGAAHYGTYVFKPSNLLSSLDEGVNGVTGKMIRVEGHVQNEMVKESIQKIEKRNERRNQLVRFTHGFNPLTFMQNKLNELSQTHYQDYKTYRDEIQVMIDKQIKVMVLEGWKEVVVDKEKYLEYDKILR